MSKEKIALTMQPIIKETLCGFCLNAAKNSICKVDVQTIDIDSVNLLIHIYREKLEKVFSALDLEYPPNIAWLVLYRYIQVLSPIMSILDNSK